MLKIDSENRLDHVLEALENPSAFTSEELKQLFSDEECLNNARAILAAREALARRHVPAPDVNEEWKAFANRHRKKSVIPLVASLTAVACVVLAFIINSFGIQHEELTVFEAVTASQTVRQETVNGITSIYVPRGMQKLFKLPDGTLVTLNADSKLIYDSAQFVRCERMVTLKGEGLFDVAKDTVHPFTVRSERLNVRVLGTTFNMRNYTTEAEKITLLSGSLQVFSLHQTDSLLISPGEQIQLTGKDKLCMKKTSHIGDFVVWTGGVFYFDNQPLVEVLCELGRWYNVNIIFRNKDSMNSRLHFKALRNESLSSIIELLNYISKTPIILENNAVIVGK